MILAIEIVLIILAFCGGYYIASTLYKRIAAHARRRETRFRQYYLLQSMWLHLRNKAVSLEKYFQKHNISKIAIYGMDEIGSCLMEELSNSDIVQVTYMIDPYAYRKYATCEVRDYKDEWENVDLIVVSDPYEYPTIVADIKKKTNLKVISLRDILVELKNTGK